MGTGSFGYWYCESHSVQSELVEGRFMVRYAHHEWVSSEYLRQPKDPGGGKHGFGFISD